MIIDLGFWAQLRRSLARRRRRLQLALPVAVSLTQWQVQLPWPGHARPVPVAVLPVHTTLHCQWHSADFQCICQAGQCQPDWHLRLPFYCQPESVSHWHLRLPGPGQWNFEASGSTESELQPEPPSATGFANGHCRTLSCRGG